MATRKPYSRISRACRFALAVNLAAIGYVKTLLEIATNQAARDEIIKLPERAARVLAFYAALHRAGKMGFLGTEATYEAIAAAVRRSIPGCYCKIGTLKGALGELIGAGMIELYWGTELTERDDRGNWRPKTFEIEPGEKQACRVRIIKLTPKAIALWSKQSDQGKAPETAAKPLSQKLPTSIKSKRCFTTPVSCAGDDRPSSSLLETGTEDKKEAGAAAGQTIGQSSTTGGESKQPASSASPQRSDVATRQKEKTAKFGPAVTRPKNPKKDSSSSWSNNQARLLSALWLALASYPRREADCLYSRAVQETDRAWPAHWPRCLDWDYWIRRWDSLVYSESRRILLHTLLPALRGDSSPATTGSTARAPAKQTRMSPARAPSAFSLGDVPAFLRASVGKLLEKGLIDV